MSYSHRVQLTLTLQCARVIAQLCIYLKFLHFCSKNRFMLYVDCGVPVEFTSLFDKIGSPMHDSYGAKVWL